ncbi:MAG TPA: hypothetical protein VFL60_08520 [Gaiellaceae bacterium]|nr:hypothetical protein [Gaiellaceae bacterium]
MAESRPVALPPARRTVGQLVAESVRFYGDNFWAVLLLGLPFLALDVLSIDQPWRRQILVGWLVGPLICAAYVRASMLASRSFWSWRAYAVALIVYIPYPLLGVYVLPAVVWFALAGLSVPAAVAEGLDVRSALKRGLQLGRADLVHAIGGLATLVLVVGITRIMLEILLNTQGGQAREIAVVLADIVLSPLLYVGGALLYVDQRARVE